MRIAAQRLVHYGGAAATVVMPINEQAKTVSGSPPPADLPWASILDALPDGVVCLEDGATVIFANPAARDLIRPHPSEPSDALGALPPEWRRLFEDASAAAGHSAAGPVQVRNMEVKTAAGETRPLEVTITESRSGNHRLQTAVIRDLTAIKHMEEALLQSRKSQAIGALAGGIAHDFNNILTALLSQLDLALDAPDLPDDARDCVIHAQTSGRRAAELITRLQTFSRQSETTTATIDLAELTDQVVLILRRTIDRRIVIRRDDLKPGEWRVRGDASQMIQAVLNLCLNARDAMPRGGTLTLSCSRCERRRGSKPPGRFISLTIRDTGEGIPAESVERLFEPYYTTRAIGRGTGLGLYIAQSIVQDLNGWLEVDSEPGRGSAFRVLLPEAREAEASGRGSIHEFVSTETRALEGRESIVIADDEEMVRMVMRAVLSYRGYQVAEAHDGEHLLDILNGAGQRFDLVLLDVDMPRLNGWDALQRIVREHPGLKVILLSGGSVDSDPDKARQMGAAGFLSKPFKNDALIQLVRTTLDANG